MAPSEVRRGQSEQLLLPWPQRPKARVLPWPASSHDKLEGRGSVCHESTLMETWKGGQHQLLWGCAAASSWQSCWWYLTLKGQCHKFLSFRFFHESSYPKLLKITLGSFQKKINLGDLRKSPCTTIINDTGGKFCHRYRWCYWYRWQICQQCQWYRQQICHRCQRYQKQMPLVSATTAANFPLLTPLHQQC